MSIEISIAFRRETREGLYVMDQIDSQQSQMNRVVRKQVFGVSDQVRHKLGCQAAEDG